MTTTETGPVLYVEANWFEVGIEDGTIEALPREAWRQILETEKTALGMVRAINDYFQQYDRGETA